MKRLKILILTISLLSITLLVGCSNDGEPANDEIKQELQYDINSTKNITLGKIKPENPDAPIAPTESVDELERTADVTLDIPKNWTPNTSVQGASDFFESPSKNISVYNKVFKILDNKSEDEFLDELDDVVKGNINCPEEELKIEEVTVSKKKCKLYTYRHYDSEGNYINLSSLVFVCNGQSYHITSASSKDCGEDDAKEFREELLKSATIKIKEVE